MLTNEQDARAAIADVLADVLDPRKIFEARYELASALMDRVVGPLIAERDRPRDLSAALEGQLAEIRRAADEMQERTTKTVEGDAFERGQVNGLRVALAAIRPVLSAFEEAKPQ